MIGDRTFRGVRRVVLEADHEMCWDALGELALEALSLEEVFIELVRAPADVG